MKKSSLCYRMLIELGKGAHAVGNKGNDRKRTGPRQALGGRIHYVGVRRRSRRDNRPNVERGS